jgi:hypothetical protein
MVTNVLNPYQFRETATTVPFRKGLSVSSRQLSFGSRRAKPSFLIVMIVASGGLTGLFAQSAPSSPAIPGILLRP